MHAVTGRRADDHVLQRRSGSSGESISYWEDTTNPDLLWTLQEAAGNRNAFAVQQATYDG